jgi:V8-like Glu-specific endopeptidase
MSTTLSDARHELVSNRDGKAAPKRFYSTGPTLGGDGRRHPVDPGGFEAIAGFQLAPAGAVQELENRSMSELTFGPRAISPAPAAFAAEPAHAAAPAAAASNRVPVPDTTHYPFRANALLRITVPGFSSPFLATGWFVGPYAVVTAAHCVYPRQMGGYMGWVSSVEVIPGLNGFPGPPPYGTAVSKSFECPLEWQKKPDLPVDYGLDYGVVLLKQDIGHTVGTYGYATYPSGELASVVANLAGYPVVSPDQSEPQGRQWYSAAKVGQVDDSFVYYDLGTRSGDSGSCVYRNIGDQSYVIAIHTADNGTNRGIRITAPLHENLTKWKSMHG